MRKDVQDIFKKTPREKQVMFFSATLSQEIRVVCKKFMQDPMEIYVDNESKLTLHGLQQFYVQLEEAQKNRKLNDLLDALEFNQVVIFVKSVRRCTELDKLLQECNFPSICIHSRLDMKERLERYKSFKDFDKRVIDYLVEEFKKIATIPRDVDQAAAIREAASSVWEAATERAGQGGTLCAATQPRPSVLRCLLGF